jgi:hypothetical protein
MTPLSVCPRCLRSQNGAHDCAPVSPDSLVARLRSKDWLRRPLREEAADRIEQLQRERDAARSSLLAEEVEHNATSDRLARITQASAKLVAAKGRFHTAQAYADFVAAYHDAIRHTTEG